jgi:hypothetical protein
MKSSVTIKQAVLAQSVFVKDKVQSNLANKLQIDESKFNKFVKAVWTKSYLFLEEKVFARTVSVMVNTDLLDGILAKHAFCDSDFILATYVCDLNNKPELVGYSKLCAEKGLGKLFYDMVNDWIEITYNDGTKDVFYRSQIMVKHK